MLICEWDCWGRMKAVACWHWYVHSARADIPFYLGKMAARRLSLSWEKNLIPSLLFGGGERTPRGCILTLSWPRYTQREREKRMSFPILGTFFYHQHHHLCVWQMKCAGPRQVGSGGRYCDSSEPWQVALLQDGWRARHHRVNPWGKGRRREEEAYWSAVARRSKFIQRSECRSCRPRWKWPWDHKGRGQQQVLFE